MVSLSFQVVLSASPMMTKEDLEQFAWGISPEWDLECDHLLRAAVSQVADREEPQDHVVLILDKVGLIPLKGRATSMKMRVNFFLLGKCQNV